jgi:sterol 3beta-glucosyltransferase
LGAMHQSSVPFLYNISPVVFPPSVDFAEWVKVTGYWFLDESSGYKPPSPLVEFIKKAREDDKKIVYIGFGSIVVENPKELTESIVDAVLSSDVRCILNKGWSDRLGAKDSKTVEIELPEEIFNSGNVPHDWLFTQIDAAVHHGGSGTTGASLRFGLPTIIKPFFGDQKFYAGRVEDLGCGLSLKSLESKALCKALKEVTTNKRMIEKAKLVGEQIRAENGVQNAINSIYVLMEYARKLSVSKFKHNISDDDDTDYDHDDTTNDMEESWLMV